MPNIKSAKKKMRQDVKRTNRNTGYRMGIRKIMKTVASGKLSAKEAIAKAFALIDKSAKKKVIHKNKAARLKSKVSKLAHAKK